MEANNNPIPPFNRSSLGGRSENIQNEGELGAHKISYKTFFNPLGSLIDKTKSFSIKKFSYYGDPEPLKKGEEVEHPKAGLRIFSGEKLKKSQGNKSSGDSLTHVKSGRTPADLNGSDAEGPVSPDSDKSSSPIRQRAQSAPPIIDSSIKLKIEDSSIQELKNLIVDESNEEIEDDKIKLIKTYIDLYENMLKVCEEGNIQNKELDEYFERFLSLIKELGEENDQQNIQGINEDLQTLFRKIDGRLDEIGTESKGEIGDKINIKYKEKYYLNTARRREVLKKEKENKEMKNKGDSSIKESEDSIPEESNEEIKALKNMLSSMFQKAYEKRFKQFENTQDEYLKRFFGAYKSLIEELGKENDQLNIQGINEDLQTVFRKIDGRLDEIDTESEGEIGDEVGSIEEVETDELSETEDSSEIEDVGIGSENSSVIEQRFLEITQNYLEFYDEVERKSKNNKELYEDLLVSIGNQLIKIEDVEKTGFLNQNLVLIQNLLDIFETLYLSYKENESEIDTQVILIEGDKGMKELEGLRDNFKNVLSEPLVDRISTFLELKKKMDFFLKLGDVDTEVYDQEIIKTIESLKNQVENEVKGSSGEEKS